MKEIKLTHGKVALVDDEYFHYLNQWKWFALNSYNNKYYAARHLMKNYKQSTILMHRVIMNTSDCLQVDHIDNNGLNNQKANLRNCTNQQNCFNRISINGNKGVSILRNNTYQVQIKINGKLKYLGVFNDIEDARKAYREAAKVLFGEFAGR